MINAGGGGVAIVLLLFLEFKFELVIRLLFKLELDLSLLVLRPGLRLTQVQHAAHVKAEALHRAHPALVRISGFPRSEEIGFIHQIR